MPAAIPASLKLVNGDPPNDADPKPADHGVPTPPAWLSAYAKQVWEAAAPDLHAKGVLTAWDRETFAILCHAIGRHRQAAIKAKSAVVVGQRGESVKHPALQIERDAAATVAKFAPQFGMLPKARQELVMGGETDPEKARRLLS